MKKKILASVISCIALSVMVAVPVTATEEIDDINFVAEEDTMLLSEEDDVTEDLYTPSDYDYYLFDDGTISIEGYEGPYEGDLVVPDTINGFTVTSIGYNAFYGCRGFTGNLIIPDSVTSIEDSAFGGCSGFTGSLTIPDSVTGIGRHAFSRCSGFTGSLTIPDSVTGIGHYAFNGCKGFTGSLTIPCSVTYIGVFPFNDCNGLNKIINNSSENVTFPDVENGYWTKEGSDEKITSIANGVAIRNMSCSHENSTLVNKKEATCKAEGYTGDKVCVLCNKVLEKGSSTSKKEHNEVFDDLVAPTCTKDGRTAGSHCSICGDEIQGPSTIPATGHKEKTYSVPATCTTSGLSPLIYCTVCKLVLCEPEIIPATGHHWDNGIIKVAPSLSNEGKKEYTCSTCERTKTETLPKLSGFKTSKIILNKGASKNSNFVNNTGKKVTYKSSNTAVVTVDSKGLLTAKGKGTAKITATVDKKAYTCTINVYNPTISGSSSVKKGSAITLKVVNGYGKTTWSSSNKQIATVNSKGVVKGIKKGKVTITAKNNGKTIKKTITVKSRFE